MDVNLPMAGTYAIAVSGGVDSVALLHHLQQQPGLRLTVAHFDHGMRDDSVKDRLFVQKLAKKYNLPFVYDRVELGPTASEAKAREARYEFLHKVRQATSSKAIITAHHQDDVLETAIINILRGTGRKGLTALGSQPHVLRPLVLMSKEAITAYAQDQGLTWHEDITNEDTSYLRNYVRHELLPRLDLVARGEMVRIIEGLRKTNQQIDHQLSQQLDEHAIDSLDRHWFTQLSHHLAMEMMAAWLRQHNIRDFSSQTLERLVIGAKVSPPGKQLDALQGVCLDISKDNLALVGVER